MNKSNKILLGVLSFVVVCVVGYALFSENINITGTAAASGDFSFEKKCFVGDVRNVTGGKLKEGGIGQESCNINGNTVTLSTELLYPSARRVYTIEVKNTGSIDGMVELNYYMEPGIKVAHEYVLELYKRTNDSLYQTYDFLKMPGSSIPNEEYGYINPWYYIMLTKEGKLLITDDLILDSGRLYQNSEGKYYLRIKPGDTLIWNPIAMWRESAEQTEYYSKFKFSVEINIEQFVEEGLTPATDVESCYRGC